MFVCLVTIDFDSLILDIVEKFEVQNSELVLIRLVLINYTFNMPLARLGLVQFFPKVLSSQEWRFFF